MIFREHFTNRRDEVVNARKIVGGDPPRVVGNPHKGKAETGNAIVDQTNINVSALATCYLTGREAPGRHITPFTRWSLPVTLEGSQSPIGWLKEVARWNIPPM